MEESQNKLKTELNRLCDEKRYSDAAKLLVKIEDVEGIEPALEDLTRNWMWKLKDVDDETWSYAYFLDGFCNEFGAYNWREKNLSIAVDAYRKSDELGNQYAALRLADCYEKGVPDKEEAAKWLRRSAEKGDANAQCRLGSYYYELSLGKELGFADAQRRFGKYSYSPGIDDADGDWKAIGKKYMAEAVKWTRLAAEQGDDLARGNFGRYYISASDEDILSKEEALKWLNVAAAGESRYAADAKQWIERLGGNEK